MPKYHNLQQSFSSGELGPEFQGRNDLKEYGQGAKRMEGMLPVVQGTASRRPGFQFVSSIQSPSVNHSVAYAKTTITRALDLFFAVTVIRLNPILPETTHRLVVEVRRYNVLGSETIGDSIGVVDLVDPSAFSGNIPTPGEVSLFPLGDGFIFTHQDAEMAPVYIKIENNSADALGELIYSLGSFRYFSDSDLTRLLSIPFAAFNVDATQTIDIAAKGGFEYYMTIANGGIWVGKYIRIRVTTFDRLFKIESWDQGNGRYTIRVVNSHLADGSIEAAFIGTQDNYALSQWGGNDGFPRCAGYFQSRLVLGGAKGSYGDIIWASQIGDIFQFTKKRYLANDPADHIYIDYVGNSEASDAFEQVLGAATRDHVVWISSQNNLLVGTNLAEYQIFSVDGTFTAATVGSRKQTGHGGIAVTPVIIDGSTIFATQEGRTLREFVYSEQQQSYITRNLNILNSKILFSEKLEFRRYQSIISQMIYQSDRDTLWILTTEGELFGVTIDLAGGTVAWHRQPTTGIVNNLSIERNDRGYSELFISVDHFDGYHVIKMGPDFINPTLDLPQSTFTEDFPIFLDFSVVGVNLAAKQTVWSGFDHFPEDTVLLYVIDGGLIGTTTVNAAGEITTPEANYVVAGLSFRSRLETLTPDIPNNSGNSRGTLSRNVIAEAILYRACDFKSGSKDGDLFDSKVPENLFTGTMEVRPHNDITRDTSFILETESPLPFGISALNIRGISYEH